jgi:hypothetical protein
MYDGGKNGAGVYQQIINIIPKHDIYFELFLGSGAIYRNKLPAPISFLFDIVPELIESWKSKVRPGDILQLCDSVLFLETSMVLINFLHDTSGNCFMYLDPPYPFFTRRSMAKIYQFELSDYDHERLLKSCSIAKFPVAISSYKNKMYDEMLSDWNHIEFMNQTRVGPVKECVYFNYPIPEILHDYRYIGRDFRNREKIKLSNFNLLSKFSRMPAAVRNNLIEELNKKYNSNLNQNTDCKNPNTRKRSCVSSINISINSNKKRNERTN